MRVGWRMLVAAALLWGVCAAGRGGEGAAKAPGKTPLADALILHFDEGSGTTAHDAIDDQNSGVLRNGPKWASTGVHGKALELDGRDDYVDCGNDPIFALKKGVTLECWFNLHVAKGPARYLISRGQDHGGGFHLFLEAGTNLTGIINGAKTRRYVVHPTRVTPGVWHHAVLTYQSGKGGAVYLDGRSAAIDDGGDIKWAGHLWSRLTIGRHDHPTASYPFDGTIDEVAIYTRALKPNEVAARLKGGPPRPAKVVVRNKRKPTPRDDAALRFPADAPATRNPDTVKEWFDRTYFNLIIDYYTEVPQRPYGTGFTREKLVKHLKMVRPGFALVYAKGHSGTTAFKSRLGTEHPLLGDDPLKVFRQATREAGVRMFLYYSGLVDGTAAERHPEWRPAGRDGKRKTGPIRGYRMAPVCPASRYLEDWVAVHIGEIMTRYDPDGIWIDGDWGCRTCYCDDCRRLAVERFGGEQAMDTARFHAWVRNEFRRKFAACIRRYKPSCLYSAGNTAPAVDHGFVNHMDWQSGDWFSPHHNRVLQSLAMRRYTTLGIPYDAMTCDTAFVKAYNTRSLPKSLDRMLQEGAGVLANGGKWCYWTYPMPNGALIPSQMRLAKACRDWAAEREALWLDTQSARQTAVVDSVPGLLSRLHSGAAKALIQLHRSPDLIKLRQLEPPISHKLLVLPSVTGLSAESLKMLEKFVRDGGTLLSAGSTAHNPAMAGLLGIKLVKRNALPNEGHVLLASGDPACLPCGWDKVEPTGAAVWWKLYKSWDHHNPNIRWLPRNYPITARMDEQNPEAAGMPAVTARRLGRGLAVHVAGDPFDGFWRFGHPTTRAFLRELLDRMEPNPLLRTEAPSWIEVALRARPTELLVHFVNGNPGFDMVQVGATDLYVDEIPRVGPYKASVRCARRPDTIVVEPGHKPLAFQWRDGRAHFTVPRFKIHTCVRIQPRPQ